MRDVLEAAWPMLLFAALVMALVLYVESSTRGEQCVAGFTHWIDANGNVRQVLDEQGHGSRCEVPR